MKELSITVSEDPASNTTMVIMSAVANDVAVNVAPTQKLRGGTRNSPPQIQTSQSAQYSPSIVNGLIYEVV